MLKESKWIKDAQKENGTQEPASNVTKKPKWLYWVIERRISNKLKETQQV